MNQNTANSLLGAPTFESHYLDYLTLNALYVPESLWNKSQRVS